MPFDGSGNYTPAGAPNFPAVSGTPIVSNYYNAVINDVAAALSLCITRDGQGGPTANINWNGKNLTNVGTLGCTTLTISGGLPVASGGTGITSVVGNGKVLISGGGGFTLANITGTGGVTVTNGAGSIQLSIGGAVTASSLTMSTGTLLGRTSAGTGAIQEITIGSGLSLSGGVLSNTGGGGGAGAPLTMNNGGGGAASGTVYDGSVAKTLSYNTLGAAPATPQVTSSASAATITPVGTQDGTCVTALATNVTLANPSGAPANMFGHVIRLKDNGTARTISFGTQYRFVGTTQPTTTVSNKNLYIAMLWNSTDSKWDVVGINQE